jgi:hypothetical protein
VRKDQAAAAAAIRDYQMRAEFESGCKLSVLCTDRGGEFTSKRILHSRGGSVAIDCVVLTSAKRRR